MLKERIKRDSSGLSATHMKSDSKWYQRSRRRTLADLHIESWNTEFLSQFDSDAYFDLIKKSRVQAVMIYTNSHVGYCNWPTESGSIHPAFLKKDSISEVIHKCHDNDIDVVLYYSLIFNNWAYETYPEWRMRNLVGEGSRTSSRYGLCCPNNLGYRAFVEKQIEEFCEYYDFEGVFFDMAFWSQLCYCDSCKKRWADEVGGDLPLVVDWNNPKWIEFQRKRENWMGEFAEFSTRVIKRHCPQASVEHQSSSISNSWIRGVTENLNDASDYTGGDLYGGFSQQSFICKLYYGLTKNQPFEYMTSRCKPDLRDHTTTKTKEEMMQYNCITMAHHGAFLFIDAVDPRGTMNPEIYEMMGGIFEETEIFEAHLKGNMISDVGVYFSLLSKISKGERDIPCEGSPFDSGIGHLNAALNVTRTLRDNNILHEVVSYSKLCDYPRDKPLIIPNVQTLSQKEETDIIAYVEEGGRLFISGEGTKGLARTLLGLEISGTTEETVTYMAPVHENNNMPSIMKEHPLTLMEPQAIARDKGENNTLEIIATTVLPYTNPSNLTQFASIHSNPPGIYTENPALVYGKYGKGEVIWVSGPIENYSSERHRNVTNALINRLISKKLSFEASLSNEIEFTLFDDKDSSHFVIHAVNVREDYKVIPIFDLKLKINVENKTPLELIRVKDGSKVEFEWNDGFAEFTISRIDFYEMFLLTYQEE